MENNETDLSEVLAGHARRIRRLEEAAEQGMGGPAATSPANWREWVRSHGWSLTYAFLAVVELVGALLLRSWLMLAGALAAGAFAWLSYQPSWPL